MAGFRKLCSFAPFLIILAFLCLGDGWESKFTISSESAKKLIGPDLHHQMVVSLLESAILQDNASSVAVALASHGPHFANASSVTISTDPLIVMAGWLGRLDTVRVLAANGADLNAVSPASNGSLLDYAVQQGHLDMVEWLLSMGARSSRMSWSNKSTPLHLAAAMGNPSMLRLLLRLGAEQELGWGVNSLDHYGRTPLHQVALAAADMAYQRNLCDRLEGIMKNPPPCPADLYDPVGSVELLLEAGADAEIRGLSSTATLLLLYLVFVQTRISSTHSSQPRV